ncbi:MAG: LysE family translocator [Acidiferrobacterales bacterium]
MDISHYLTFLVVSFGVIVIPGPNVLVIVSTSILHGRIRGLQTVAGTSLAMFIQLLIVGIGTSWLIAMLSSGLSFLKWFGVTYLFYLGAKHLIQARGAEETLPEIRGSTTFARGFITSLINPKTLLFFSAYLPQFVSTPQNYAFEISFLSLSFLFMAILLDSCYAIFTVKLKSLLSDRFSVRLRSGFSGILYFGAGAWLAASRRL